MKAENINIWVRPELTGKATQWGDMDELIQLANEVEMVLPVIDFAHLHARTAGKWNTYNEFARVFERLGKEIVLMRWRIFTRTSQELSILTKERRNILILMNQTCNTKI